jgi:anti-sigma factor RsiW
LKSKCQEVIEQISNYLDGDLNAELKRFIEAHTCGCHHCEVIINTTRKTIDLYCDGRLFALPVPVHERLLVVLRRQCRDRVV